MKLLTILLIILAGCTNEHWVRSTICDDRTVVDVGGCNKYGYCKVKLSDGTKEFMDMPLKGDYYCVSKYIKKAAK